MRNTWMVGAFLAVLLGVTPVKAATVTAGGTTVCSNYGSIDVGATGNVVINSCTSGGGGSTGSTNANFAVSAPSTATVGTAITATVTRTIGTGGTAGADTLILASTLSAAFTPTVSFAATDTAKTVSVNFTAAGSAVLSVSGQGSGNTATPSAAITVSTGGGGACAGITPFDIKNSAPYPELPTSGYGFPAIRMDAASSSEYATASVGFTVPSSTPSSGYWVFQYAENPFGSLTDMYSAVSICPGDMRGVGTGGGSAEDIKCRKDPASSSMGPVISSSSTTPYCQLTPGTTYYLNMRSKNLNVTGVGFYLTAGTN